MQILTPDFSGRSPPPTPPPSLSPPPLSSSLSPCLPPTFRLFLSLSHPHCLSHLSHLSLISLSSLSQLSLISLSSLSHLSHLTLISFISLSSLSHLSLLSLSLSPLCLSSFRLSSLAGGSGQRTTYRGLFTPASKKSAVFFPTSLPSTFPFWSASFRPPLGLKYYLRGNVAAHTLPLSASCVSGRRKLNDA